MLEFLPKFPLCFLRVPEPDFKDFKWFSITRGEPFALLFDKSYGFIGKLRNLDFARPYMVFIVFWGIYDPCGQHKKWKNSAFGNKCYFNYDKNGPKSFFLIFQGSFQASLATKRPSGNKVKKTTIFYEKIGFRVGSSSGRPRWLDR